MYSACTSVSLDAGGVHIFYGDLSFMRRYAGSYVEATSIVETPNTDACWLSLR